MHFCIGARPPAKARGYSVEFPRPLDTAPDIERSQVMPDPNKKEQQRQEQHQEQRQEQRQNDRREDRPDQRQQGQKGSNFPNVNQPRKG